MRRLAFHLLLAMTLVLNGIAAPWAMARMNHAGHGQAPPVLAAGAAADAGHAQHDRPAASHDCAAPVQNDTSCTDPERSCCDGAACACGCVLPPALGMPAPAAAAPALAFLVFPLPARRSPPGHDTPPFRPPAA
ncbi:CopL family metal-binding regulatory protein [Tahibacter harae]|uniref:CopL family metal-binding regulatory protein n=1 Tax=Tahibacter harae TaxID=2963937 RepID=A0ABT1QMA5_9GAMM|nr:CopL family metal-binding regulatory protein [Tahibacter harae]MCQ4163654.1 CopL family metal-binding regulatory protein [Tahibacter harae]